MTQKRQVSIPEGVLGGLEQASAVQAPLPSQGLGAQQGRGQATSGVQGVYIISVAARIVAMHPQTLRKYERVGLVHPSRTMGMLRLYSEQDITRLRLIKHLVDDVGMNLAGVEFVLGMFNRLLEARSLLEAVQEEQAFAEEVRRELLRLLQVLGMEEPR
ncbi:MAG: MerR family transcriptional regulator [Chloroflexi bacterium]|nr:MerR family transcriptional regulator [Chloroflexota bacterium]